MTFHTAKLLPALQKCLLELFSTISLVLPLSNFRLYLGGFFSQPPKVSDLGLERKDRFFDVHC
jgi:hypothetical protein